MKEFTYGTQHAIKMVTILKKTGALDSLKPLIAGIEIKGMKKDEIEAKQREISADLIVTVLSNMDAAEADIYNLVGDIRGITADEAKALPLNDTINTLKGIFTSAGFADFFGSATA